jgi:hypothetical protein
MYRTELIEASFKLYGSFVTADILDSQPDTALLLGFSSVDNSLIWAVTFPMADCLTLISALLRLQSPPNHSSEQLHCAEQLGSYTLQSLCTKPVEAWMYSQSPLELQSFKQVLEGLAQTLSACLQYKPSPHSVSSPDGQLVAVDPERIATACQLLTHCVLPTPLLPKYPSKHSPHVLDTDKQPERWSALQFGAFVQVTSLNTAIDNDTIFFMPFTELNWPDKLLLTISRASDTVTDIAVTSTVLYEV